MRATTGSRPGEIMVRWRPVRGARFYRIYVLQGHAVDIEDNMAQAVRHDTTNSRFMAEGLHPLEYYTFYVEAVGTKTTSPLSGMANALSIGFRTAS